MRLHAFRVTTLGSARIPLRPVEVRRVVECGATPEISHTGLPTHRPSLSNGEAMHGVGDIVYLANLALDESADALKPDRRRLARCVEYPSCLVEVRADASQLSSKQHEVRQGLTPGRQRRRLQPARRRNGCFRGVPAHRQARSAGGLAHQRELIWREPEPHLLCPCRVGVEPVSGDHRLSARCRSAEAGERWGCG